MWKYSNEENKTYYTEMTEALSLHLNNLATSKIRAYNSITTLKQIG